MSYGDYGYGRYGVGAYGGTPTAPFADVQQAVDAMHKPVQWLVLVGGVATTCTAVTTRYSVDEPVGTCMLTLPLPLPANVTFGADVEVQAGYPGAVGAIFRGVVPTLRGAISRTGRTATIIAASHGGRLARKDTNDLVLSGPISLKAIFESLCSRRLVLSYRSDDTTAPDGSTVITFGNNSDANGRTVTIPRTTQAIDFLSRTARLVGYRVFDTPEGVRQQRVSGMPNSAATFKVVEAWNALDLTWEGDANAIVNYREVFGADYTDADGIQTPIRSIAETVPNNPILAAIWGEGYQRDELSDNLIDEYWLADIVRNVAEIDAGDVRETVTWETHGAPDLMPGDVAEVRSDTLALAGRQWVMSVQHTMSSDRGFKTTCTGWRGAGSALPAGNDCVVTPIPGGPFRLGDEYLPWYSVPSPYPGPVIIPFTVTEHYTSLAIYGLAHGSNSQFIGGQNTDLTISRFEIHQNGEKIGEGNLPVLDENYAQQLPYSTSDEYWDRFVIPISGTANLEPGTAELRIIAGENSSLPSSTKRDDLEVKDLVLRSCGVGVPVIATEVAA